MNITIFTSTTCAYCVSVKKFLTAKGHSYEEVNLDDSPERREEVQRLSGALTTPVTVVTKGDKKTIIVGYNLSKLAPAVAD